MIKAHEYGWVKNKTIIGLKWWLYAFCICEWQVKNKTIIGLKSITDFDSTAVDGS